MKVKGLDGRLYVWKMPGKNKRETSQYHERARIVISNLYWSFYEEVYLPGCRSKLYLDFYIPAAKMAVEVQGSQHNQYTPFFHGDRVSYSISRERDSLKRLWCEQNNISLVELLAGQTDDEWKSILRGKNSRS